MAVFSMPVVLFTSASSPRTVLSFAKQPSWQVARACGESAKLANANSAKAGYVMFVSVFTGLFPFIFLLQNFRSEVYQKSSRMKFTEQFGSSVGCVNEPFAHG